MGTVQAALTAASARLAAAGVADPVRDARLLMAEALGIEPGALTPRAHDPLGPAAPAFEALVAERARRRPVAQILGRRAFWGRMFEVTDDVLDPRPETETIIAAALDGRPAGRVLDLGTGSGALLVTLLAEWPDARGLGTDASAAALAVAARNAERHTVAERAAFRLADWTNGIDDTFDLVVCNPPYIPAAAVATLEPDVRDWEPRAALTPGETGLEAYRRIVADLGRLVAPGGRAFFEFGEGQGPEVGAVFEAAGLGPRGLLPDLDGRPRVLALG